jgi:hypothetical protein
MALELGSSPWPQGFQELMTKFVEFRGRGLYLSPMDLYTMETWIRLGTDPREIEMIFAEIACKNSKRGRRFPQNLAYFNPWVDTLIPKTPKSR